MHRDQPTTHPQTPGANPEAPLHRQCRTVVKVEPWRKILLALVATGCVGVAAELGLLGHYEDWAQRIPLLALIGGTIAGVWAGVGPSRSSLRFLQALMTAFAATGVLGVYFHLRSNFEFEVEMLMETLPPDAGAPSIASLDLVVASLRGALPALAPLAMLQLGMLGLLASWRHPVLLQAKSRVRLRREDRLGRPTDHDQPRPSTCKQATPPSVPACGR